MLLYEPPNQTIWSSLHCLNRLAGRLKERILIFIFSDSSLLISRRIPSLVTSSRGTVVVAKSL